MNRRMKRFWQSVREGDSYAVSKFLTELTKKEGTPALFPVMVQAVILSTPDLPGPLPDRNINIEFIEVNLSTNSERDVEVDEIPPLVRSFARFVAAVVVDDIETAWSIFLLHFGEEATEQQQEDGKQIVNHLLTGVYNQP